MTGSATSSPRVSAWRRLLLAICLVFGVATAGQGAVVRTFNSIDVPATIPEVPNPPGSQAGDTRSTVAVSGVVGSVTKLTVSMYITHEYTSDLQVRLVPPDPATGAAGTGEGIIIVDDIYSTAIAPPPGQTGLITSGDNAYGGATTGIGSGMAAPNNGRVVFDDVLGVVIDRADPTMVNNVRFNVYLRSGTYRSQQPLATFNGLSGTAVNGTWTLLIRDQAAIDQGNLRAWSLTITEAGPHIWTGEGADTNWSTAGNWEDGNVPSDTERNALVIFPDNATGRIATKDDLPGAGTLTIANLQIAEGFTLDGAAFALGTPSATITVLPGTGANAGVAVDVDSPLQLQNITTLVVDSGRTLNLNGAITNDAGAVATGGGLTKTGLGTVFLDGSNGYTGVTTVSAGILGFDEALGLGTAAGGTVVASGATLQVTGAGATVAGEPLSLAGTGTAGQGALLGSAAVTWNGPITLAATGTTGVGAAGVNVTLGSFAAGTGLRELSALGTGTVTLAGALPTGAVTSLTVNGGTLIATVAQPNVGSLTLNGGTITPTAAITLSDSITVTGTAAGSTLGAGTINLGGGRGLAVGNGTATNDLTVLATFPNGSLNKTGSGTVSWNSTSAANLTVSAGTLTGSGTVGNLTVGRARLAPTTAAFNVGNLTLSDESLLVYTGQQVVTTGTATIGGGLLQPAATGTVIAVNGTAPASTIGEFALYPRSGTAINYGAGDGNDVATGAALGGGGTASFTAAPYAGAEGGPAVLLQLSGGGMTVAITSGGGVLTPGGDFAVITSVAPAANIPLTINDDFLEEGTESGDLVIIPLTGGVASSANGTATLTITDNDKDDQRTCGFGSGLTVFLLLGFAMALRARLRRP